MKRRKFLQITGGALVGTAIHGLSGNIVSALTPKTAPNPYRFPKGLYTDVRLEDAYETYIQYNLGNMENLRERRTNAAFVRVYDGKRWYYSAVSDLDKIQSEIDALAALAHPNNKINSHPIVRRFQVNQGQYLRFKNDDISQVPRREKIALLESLFPIVKKSTALKMWNALYLDKRVVKTFYSSKGSALEYDFQTAGMVLALNFKEKERVFTDLWDVSHVHFADLKNQEADLKAFVQTSEHFLKNYVPVKPGKYPVILSPMVAGVFAHESFGHKSEADFMIGDETMKREWTMGKRVGSALLSIMDTGLEEGTGHVPYDDEGTRAGKNYLIKNGILSGRLHSGTTAALLSEKTTGNARAINFEFEPIVRMTTTYIKPGSKTKEALISEITDGYLIETLKYGTGMSTFTLAPARSYHIKNGKIAEPVQISVISGTVFETLGQIDGVSNKLELHSFTRGGCGKFDQYPLPVGFGGPYVRVKSMNVQ